MANVLFKLLTRAQFDALTPVAGTFYRVQETDNSESFYNGSNKLYRNDLDVAEFALATATGGVVTIKAIKEIDGAIAVGTVAPTYAPKLRMIEKTSMPDGQLGIKFQVYEV